MIHQKPTTSVDRVVVPLVAIVLTSRTGHDRWFQLNTRRSGRGVRSLATPKLLKLSASIFGWTDVQVCWKTNCGKTRRKTSWVVLFPFLVLSHIFLKPPEDANPKRIMANQPAPPQHMGVSKNSGKTPQIIPFVHRVFHYFHHPFWGVNTPIFGNTHIPP